MGDMNARYFTNEASLDWDSELSETTDLEGDDDATEIESSDEQPSSEDQSSDSGEDSGESGQEDSEAKDEASNSKEEDSSGKEESGEQREEQAEESLIEVKVDGEIQKVPLQELKNNYAGKVAYDKKFSEIDRERKEVVAERDSLQGDITAINEYVNELGNKMRNASMLEGLYEIASLNNIGPHQVKKAIIAELMPEINRMADLSPDQLDFEYQRQELEYNKELQQKEYETMQARQAEESRNQQLNSLIDSSGISMDEYREANSFLSARQQELGEEVTPELTIQYAQFAKAEGRAADILNGFNDGKHAQDEDVMNGVIDIALQYPEFSDEDIIEVISEAFEGAKNDVVEQKIEKVTKSNQSKPKKKEEVIQEDNGYDLDWDDL